MRHTTKLLMTAGAMMGALLSACGTASQTGAPRGSSGSMDPSGSVGSSGVSGSSGSGGRADTRQQPPATTERRTPPQAAPLGTEIPPEELERRKRAMENRAVPSGDLQRDSGRE